ncbi:GntR family transcriptional regulator [Acholeplasma sp. OttesenSCG-928-E16]|nr:GntR family transcriptional regulator [Acholeplasma sp. OttesenSCG-928-E16]
MKIDLNNPDKPLFLLIAEAIEDNILKGVFEEETQIPSSTEISISFKINPATSNKGVNLLVDEGIIYKKRGIGMFVTSGAKEKIRKKRYGDFYEKYIIPLYEEGKKLEITEQELDFLLKKGKENEYNKNN